jgi:hypothetical protein
MGLSDQVLNAVAASAAGLYCPAPTLCSHARAQEGRGGWLILQQTHLVGVQSLVPWSLNPCRKSLDTRQFVLLSFMTYVPVGGIPLGALIGEQR